MGSNKIIRFKFTTNFDRCAMLIVSNCLTKNFEPDEFIHNCKLVRCYTEMKKRLFTEMADLADNMHIQILQCV